jgi:hypothetical protein
MRSENFTWGIFQETTGRILGLGTTAEDAWEDARAQLGDAAFSRKKPRLHIHPITPELGDAAWLGDYPVMHGVCGKDAQGHEIIGTRTQATAWRQLLDGDRVRRKENLYTGAFQ